MSRAKAIAFILGREKGLIDDPQDPGGLTNHGIALGRHPELTADQIRNMTEEQAAAIYAGPQYWGAVHGDELPDALQLPMLDIAVLEGGVTAIRMLQTALYIQADGRWGPQTVRALVLSVGPDLLEELSAIRIVALAAQGGWSHDGKGWSARVVRAAMEAVS